MKTALNECGLCRKPARSLVRIRIKFFTMIEGPQKESPVNACRECIAFLDGDYFMHKKKRHA